MFSLDQKYSSSIFILVYIVSIFIRSSPEILVNHSQSSTDEIQFVFSYLNFSPAFRFTIVTINVSLMFVGIFQIFCLKRSSYLLQLYHYILGPLQLYLCRKQVPNLNLLEFNKRVSYYSINMMQLIVQPLRITSLFIIISPLILSFKHESLRIKSINTISWHYEFLIGLNLVLMTAESYFNLDYNIKLLIFLIVLLAKSIICYKRINYEEAEIEYCSVLGELTTWISFFCLVVSETEGFNSSILLWINTFIVIVLVLRKNRFVTLILEKKYKRAIDIVKRSLADDVNSSQTRRNIIDQKSLTEMFVAFISVVKQNELSRENWHKICLCQSIFAQLFIIHDLSHRLQVIEKQDANIKNEYNRQQTRRSNFTKGINNEKNTIKSNNHLPIDTKFNETNTEIQWELVWSLTQTIKEIDELPFFRLRMLLIHQFPLLNNRTNYRLLYLYYLNQCQKSNIRSSTLHETQQQLTYKYLTEKIFLENRKFDNLLQERSSMADNNKVNDLNRRDFMNGEKKNFEYLLETIENTQKNDLKKVNKFMTLSKEVNCLAQYPSKQTNKSCFDLYHKQAQNQKKIHFQFDCIITHSYKILSLQSKDQQKQQLVESLLQKNRIKNLIKESIVEMQPINLFKSIIYKFMYEYYIDNVPHIAINNLKERNVDEFINHGQKKNTQGKSLVNLLTKKTIATTMSNIKLSKAITNDDFFPYTNMMAFVSGIKSFGSLTYCCANFRKKMELQIPQRKQSSNGKLPENFSIYNIMLPLWVDKHLNVTKTCNVYDYAATHSGNKFHLLSHIEKIVYQISFQMHFIVRSMDDILLGLDIKAREVDKLKIFNTEGKLVFENLKSKKWNRFNSRMGGVSGDKENKTSRYYRKDQINKEKLSQLEEWSENVQKQSYNQSTQIIFGQDYEVFRLYKNPLLSEKQGANLKFSQSKRIPQSKNLMNMNNHQVNDDTNSILSQSYRYNATLPHVNPEIFTKKSPSLSLFSLSSATTRERAQHQNAFADQKFMNEIKMRQYANNELFFKKKLLMFSIIQWVIPPIVLLISLIIKEYASYRQNLNFNLYSTKLSIEKQFLLADTHLQINLYHFYQLHSHYDPSRGWDMSEIISILSNDVIQDVVSVNQRQQLLNSYIAQYDTLHDVFFEPIDPSSSSSYSFFYNSLIYEISLVKYLSMIGLNQTMSTFPQKMSNQSTTDKLYVQWFFKKFMHHYEDYFGDQQNSFNSFFHQVNQIENKVFQFSKNSLLYLLIIFGGLSFIGAVQYAIFYIDLQFNIQKMVLSLMYMTEQQMLKAKESIRETQDLLQNCKFSMPQKIIQKYNNLSIASNPKHRGSDGIDDPHSFNHMEHYKISNRCIRRTLKLNPYYIKTEQPYSSRTQIFVHYLKLIIFFTVIVCVCETLLIMFINEIIGQVQLVQKFSQKDQHLAKIISISNEIGLEMAYASTNFVDKSELSYKVRVAEYSNLQKLHVIKSLELGQQTYINYTFSNICELFPSAQISKPMLCKSKTFSYSECISSNLKQFRSLITHFESSSQINIGQMNAHLKQVHVKLSMLNWFAGQYFKISEQNYMKMKSDPTKWLNLLVIEMVTIIILFNWYIYENLYKKMKISYLEVFSIHSVREMQQIQPFRQYVNHAFRRNNNYVQGEYTK